MENNINPDLVELLIRKQSESGLTNVEFARLYGLAEAQWSRIRNRKQLPGMDFLSMILKNHPYDLTIQTAVIHYLATRNGNSEDFTSKSKGT